MTIIIIDDNYLGAKIGENGAWVIVQKHINKEEKEGKEDVLK